MTRPAHASIDLDALLHNLYQVKRLAPNSAIMAIVKADAYGHGLLKCCQALQTADAFGLLDINEAIRLRKAGFTQPICLLEGFFDTDEIGLIAEYKLQPVIHSEWQLEILEKSASAPRFSVWLKIDTGMNRLGFAIEEFANVFQRLQDTPCIDEISMMSHLSDADAPVNEKTERQLKSFLGITESAGADTVRSLANSAAVLAHPVCHLDWVRPGIMLYGSSPFTDKSAESLNLRPVMSLHSEIISIRNCKQGDAVGYGGIWNCPEDMRVGVVACGYGDGYPRHAPTGTPVGIDGKITPLIGRVSMDMITVDLRGNDSVKVGSPVELWGNNIAVDEVAQSAGTLSYELLCGITERVKRQEVYG